MDPRPCALCRIDTAPRRLTVVYELEVCHQCHYGDLPARLRSARRWSMDIERTDAPQLERFEVTIRAGREYPGEVDALFVEERSYHKVIKVFRPELEAGVRIFDDHVYVRTTTEEATLALLARASARGAIVELLSHSTSIKPSYVRIGKESLEAVVTSEDRSILTLAPLSCAVLLHHTEELSPRGRSKRPYR